MRVGRSEASTLISAYSGPRPYISEHAPAAIAEKTENPMDSNCITHLKHLATLSLRELRKRATGKTLTVGGDLRELLLKHDMLDNWMLRRDIVAHLFYVAGWMAKLDIAVDRLGSNSQCKRFYNILTNALKQTLDDEEIICNPAYSITEDYLLKLERTKRRAPRTKAMVILPEWKQRRWFKRMVTRNQWRVLWRFPRGSKLFSRPDPEHVFDEDKRHGKFWTKWPVLVLVYNDSSFDNFEQHDFKKQWLAMVAKEADVMPGYGTNDRAIKWMRTSERRPRPCPQCG